MPAPDQRSEFGEMVVAHGDQADGPTRDRDDQISIQWINHHLQAFVRVRIGSQSGMPGPSE